jgi:hypothetical protein
MKKSQFTEEQITRGARGISALSREEGLMGENDMLATPIELYIVASRLANTSPVSPLCQY